MWWWVASGLVVSSNYHNKSDILSTLGNSSPDSWHLCYEVISPSPVFLIYREEPVMSSNYNAWMIGQEVVYIGQRLVIL